MSKDKWYNRLVAKPREITSDMLIQQYWGDTNNNVNISSNSLSSWNGLKEETIFSTPDAQEKSSKAPDSSEEFQARFFICLKGIIGLLWASIFHFRGFRDFVVTELSERRRNAACSMGLGLKVLHPDSLFTQYQEAKRNGNEDWGFDVIVDCTGAPKAIEQEFLYTRRGMLQHCLHLYFLISLQAHFPTVIIRLYTA